MPAARSTAVLAALALCVPGLSACSTGNPTAAPTSASASAQTPDRAEVKTFVKQAKAYAKANGKRAALATFTQSGGPFHQGELYIYAYDFDGTVIAHGGDPDLVGRNLMDMTDSNGVKVIEELAALARSGSGWLEYTWPNPQHANAEEPKLGYVEKVNDNWFLGSGVYPAQAKR